MQKLLLVAGGLVAGFVLAVVVSRFLLGSGGDTTIKLAAGAPEIPASLSESAPLTTHNAAGSPGDNGQPAAPAVTAPVEQAPAAPATPPYLHFRSDPAQSRASLTVTQGSIMGDSLLFANGSNITGDVFLTPTGGMVDGKPSAFQLDLRTMKSSDAGMTDFFKTQMEVGKFPLAEFVAETSNGIPANFTDGNEFSFTMTGPLTMHGRTRNITWRVKARQQGDFFAYAADGDFLMTDYGWTPPNYGVAWAKNSVHIQVQVIARRDASGGEPQARAVTPAPATTANAGPDVSVQAPGTTAPATLLPSQIPAGEAPAAAAGGQPAGTPGGLSSLTSLFPSGGSLPSLDDLMKLLNPEDLLKLFGQGLSR